MFTFEEPTDCEDCQQDASEGYTLDGRLLCFGCFHEEVETLALSVALGNFDEGAEVTA
tara:strand:+ start:296 stop:469 length:174 start_codon:yes stop_codon:yes gene_type:complete